MPYMVGVRKERSEDHVGLVVPQTPVPGQHLTSATDESRNGVVKRVITLEKLGDIQPDVAKCLAKFLLDLTISMGPAHFPTLSLAFFR
jgi:hypothetical protein